jgi:tight adherence protein B
MIRRGRAVLVLAVAFVLGTASAAAAEIQLTPVDRVPFPERAYVVDVGTNADLLHGRLSVSENGAPIRRFQIRPVTESPLNSGVVLALDASNSMAGDPFTAALAAVRSFVSRRTGSERIGMVVFNDQVHVLQEPTTSAKLLTSTLNRPPRLGYGTHIYDAVSSSLELLKAAPVSTRIIVLLSDGADVGSIETLDTVTAAAQQAHVRIFTIGLLSRAYNGDPLRSLAEKTGGSYFEASSAPELASIYEALGHRLASQYLLQYTSRALPKSSVTLRLSADGVGAGSFDYTAPTPKHYAPFHRSLFKRFVLSPAATGVLSLLLAAMVGGFLLLLFGRRETGLQGRVGEFLHGVRPPSERLKERSRNVRASLVGSPRAHGRLAKLERDLEIAQSKVTAVRFAGYTAAATLVCAIIFAIISPVLILLGLLVPLAPRGWLKRKLRKIRDEFNDQLPANLQVLASAMRAGHSFSGALAVVVENAHEPSRRELRRAVNDDQLGVSMDEALRRVAARMDSRDLHQVALLSELQRTAGGNAAEVLDTVVETIRERGEIRRLVRTLTAQGRMARWILTAIPAVVAFFLWLMQPSLMNPLFLTAGGQIALVIASLMTVTGSLIIQRIVDIKV